MKVTLKKSGTCLRKSCDNIEVMIFVNFKTYSEASAGRALELAKICRQVEQQSQVPITPCVQALDLDAVVSVAGPAWVEHIDPVESGRNTGYVTAAAVKLHGAAGTLLNHSEHLLNFEDLKKAILLAKGQNLKIMVLVSEPQMVEKIDLLKPDYIGLEEPSFIGGPTAMVRSEKYRGVIKDFVKQIKFAIPIIGAGINQKEDIVETLALGVKGVLIASAVVLAANPQSVLIEMSEAFH